MSEEVIWGKSKSCEARCRELEYAEKNWKGSIGEGRRERERNPVLARVKPEGT